MLAYLWWTGLLHILSRKGGFAVSFVGSLGSMKSFVPRLGVGKVGQIQQLSHPKRILWKVCLTKLQANAAGRNMHPQSPELPWHRGALFPLCVNRQERQCMLVKKLSASYLVNRFVDKSSHLPDKDGLQKVMWGATLPFTAVWYCFRVLAGKGRQTSDSLHNQYRQTVCSEKLLHFSGFTPNIKKEKNRNCFPCTIPFSSVISRKGEWDACGIRFLLKGGTKLVSWTKRCCWLRQFIFCFVFWRGTLLQNVCVQSCSAHHHYFFSKTNITRTFRRRG